MGVVVTQKKVVAVAVLVFIASCIPATAFAGPKQSLPSCKSTDAVKHAPVTVSRPTSFLNGDRIITLNTNCGNIVISADTKDAPAAVTAMTTLAQAGFFNNSLCHRLTTSDLWILQCGDPTASGEFQLPWWYPNENLPGNVTANYPEGTVAMAHRPHDPSQPAQNGSQFFIVYKDSTLPPDYTIWGHVIKGLNIVKYVATKGTLSGSSSVLPKQPIAIQSVSVK